MSEEEGAYANVVKRSVTSNENPRETEMLEEEETPLYFFSTASNFKKTMVLMKVSYSRYCNYLNMKKDIYCIHPAL